MIYEETSGRAMEGRAKGIEPLVCSWEAAVLPLKPTPQINDLAGIEHLVLVAIWWTPIYSQTALRGSLY